jgi:putative NADPH-quinone reductase
MGTMKNLIIVAHPDRKSFCYAGIVRTIVKTLKVNKEDVKIIDLYAENTTFVFDFNKIKEYKELIKWSDRIYIVSPVWWFRTTPALESFFDQIFTPGFAYNFVPLTKLYGYPKPLLGDKKVRTYLTHGAPALPVVSLYLNSVKLRLVMGVYSFVFGWFKTKTRQFWSVPFVSQEKREEYLKRVEQDVKNDLKK